MAINGVTQLIHVRTPCWGAGEAVDAKQLAREPDLKFKRKDVGKRKSTVP